LTDVFGVNTSEVCRKSYKWGTAF